MFSPSLLAASVCGVLLALAGVLTWGVLAGGYRAGLVIPATMALGVLVVGLRLLWSWRYRRPGTNERGAHDARRSAWALAAFVLGVLMGWLCGELVGFVLLPVLGFIIIPRARRQDLLPVTLPPFGFGLVLLPLFFLITGVSGTLGWSLALLFTPEFVIGTLLMLPIFWHTRHSASQP